MVPPTAAGALALTAIVAEATVLDEIRLHLLAERGVLNHGVAWTNPAQIAVLLGRVTVDVPVLLGRPERRGHTFVVQVVHVAGGGSMGGAERAQTRGERTDTRASLVQGARIIPRRVSA